MVPIPLNSIRHGLPIKKVDDSVIKVILLRCHSPVWLLPGDRTANSPEWLFADINIAKSFKFVQNPLVIVTFQDEYLSYFKCVQAIASYQ